MALRVAHRKILIRYLMSRGAARPARGSLFLAAMALAVSLAADTGDHAAPTPRIDREVDARIAACYPPMPDCAACGVLENRSEHTLRDTSRHFINLPSDLYPKLIFEYFKTVRGDASAGVLFNAGKPGEAEGAPDGCWSTYFEFDGLGEIELRVPSTRPNTPDYVVHFVVKDAD